MSTEVSPLQVLFEAPILEQVRLDPGYSGHANDVWRVRTANEDVVVRISRTNMPDNPFRLGCRLLFGIDPIRINDLRPLNALLGSLCSLAVPQVLRTGTVDTRPCLVVERMLGTPLPSFAVLSDRGLKAFGRDPAHIHARRFVYYGSPVGDFRYAPSRFSDRLIQTMCELVRTFYQQDHKISASLEGMCQAAEYLLPSPAGALVMVDLDPSQFLIDHGQVTAMVDTEAYGVGPRELDFIALEYVCDIRSAPAIADGYASVRRLPDLSAIRSLYRYLYRLLEVQGDTDLDQWMSRPAVFDMVVA